MEFNYDTFIFKFDGSLILKEETFSPTNIYIDFENFQKIGASTKLEVKGIIGNWISANLTLINEGLSINIKDGSVEYISILVSNLGKICKIIASPELMALMTAGAGESKLNWNLNMENAELELVWNNYQYIKVCLVFNVLVQIIKFPFQKI